MMVGEGMLQGGSVSVSIKNGELNFVAAKKGRTMKPTHKKASRKTAVSV